MNKVILILLFFCISISCFSQIEKETQLILDQTKSEIERCLDSSNYYFDLVIFEHKRGVDNETLIRKYSSAIDFWERRINNALEKANQLCFEGRISQKELDMWINGINLKASNNKNEKIKSFGINFSEVPVTHYYVLSQLYEDSLNHFSFKFPADWVIKSNSDPIILEGKVLIDSVTRLNTLGYFVVAIDESAKAITTEQFYDGNLELSKKTYKDFKIVTEKDISINEISAKYIVFQCTTKDLIPMTSSQIYFVKNNKGYILMGTGLTTYYKEPGYLFVEISRTFKIE